MNLARSLIFGAVCALVLFSAPGPGWSLSSRPDSSLPPVGHAAPSFALVGADGKKHALSEYRGRTVVLYFFCGCVWCQQSAQAWGEIQRSGSLAPAGSAAKTARPPVTLVVYAGDAGAARDFARQQGMDPTQTVLLPDTEMKVTDDIYHAEPCPRVLVIDPNGVIRYENVHKDDTPRKAPAMAIVSRAIDAVRSCQGAAKP